MTGEFTLKNPLTKEDWDKIADVELEKTKRIWFKTPSGKSVEFIPVSVIDAIKSEIAEYLQAEGFGSEYRNDVELIIDRHTSGKENS